MAYSKKKKKYHIETPAERAWIEEKLNAYKKWYKPYKGEIVYTYAGATQLFARYAKYNTNDELNADAQILVDEMNALDKSKKWKIVSTKIIGQTIDEI